MQDDRSLADALNDSLAKQQQEAAATVADTEEGDDDRE